MAVLFLLTRFSHRSLRMALVYHRSGLGGPNLHLPLHLGNQGIRFLPLGVRSSSENYTAHVEGSYPSNQCALD